MGFEEIFEFYFLIRYIKLAGDIFKTLLFVNGIYLLIFDKASNLLELLFGFEIYLPFWTIMNEFVDGEFNFIVNHLKENKANWLKMSKEEAKKEEE